MKGTVIKYLNARKGNPGVNAPVTGILSPGTIIELNANLFRGDCIDGNADWYADFAGNFYWSGGISSEKDIVLFTAKKGFQIGDWNRIKEGAREILKGYGTLSGIGICGFAGSEYIEVQFETTNNQIPKTLAFTDDENNNIEVPVRVSTATKPEAHESSLVNRIWTQFWKTAYGTPGCLVTKEGRNEDLFLLSCCHTFFHPVHLYSSNQEQPAIVDGIGQIGVVESAMFEDHEDFALIRLNETGKTQLLNRFGTHGPPTGIREVTAADRNTLNLHFYGAATAQNSGIVDSENFDTDIQYKLETYHKNHLIKISRSGNTISQGGDSGSILMDDQGRMAGIVVAGDLYCTYAMHMTDALNTMNLKPYCQ